MITIITDISPGPYLQRLLLTSVASRARWTSAKITKRSNMTDRRRNLGESQIVANGLFLTPRREAIRPTGEDDDDDG
eukprot:891305-Karenia_brevis.AAC.1